MRPQKLKPMNTATHSEPGPVNNRLLELGWTKEELLEAVSASVSSRNSCTLNDPSSAPGWMAWKDGVRRIRELGIQKGLIRDDSDGVPCVWDTKRNLKFTVVNTDAGTGIAEGQPSNRTKKGAATERLVAHNEGAFRLLLADSLNGVALTASPTLHEGRPVYWYLCIFAEGDVVRAELSCPLTCSGGYFTDFLERIVLIGDDDADLIRTQMPDEDGGADFEVEVVRKLS